MAVSYIPSGEERYPYRGERVEGVEIVVNDRNAVDAPELGIEAVSALWKLYHCVLEQIKAGDDPRKIAAGWQSELAEFKVRRAKYLLYK